MKSFRKILYLFLIIFTLSFSIDGEKSKVVLDKRYDTAKLKIGVTKLISKELPLEFHAESKKIYGEIDIDENDLVFVSETLDEMPSVSNTNGRKAINNIKKYLTKEIKKSPKFEYQIVEGKSEADKKEGKKYLLIDCKEQLSSVYVYVVEKGSYKVKEVYKGVFAQPFSSTTSESYGNLIIGSDTIRNEYRKITMKSGKLFVSKAGNYNSEDTLDTIRFEGKFPERVMYSKLKEESGYKDPYVIVEVTSKYGTVKSDEIKLSKSKNGYSDYQTNVTLKDNSGQDATVIGVISDDDHNEENFLSLFIRRPRPFEDVECKVELKYGYYWVGKFQEVITHSFRMNITGDGEQLLPEGTEGKILFDNPRIFLRLATSIIGGSVNGEIPNVNIPNISDTEYRGNGKFLKKPLREELDVNKIQDGVDLKITLETSTIKGLSKTETKTVILKDNATDIWNGKVDETKTEFELYDVIGRKIGKIGLFSDSETDDYYKIKIEGWDREFVHQTVNAKFTLVYEKVANRGKKDEKRKVTKKDVYTVIVSPVEENIPPNTKGTLIITNPIELAGHDIFIDRNGKVGIRTNAKHDKGEDKSPTFKKEQLIWSGQLPEKFITTEDSGNWVNWGDNARLIIRGDNGFGEVKTENKEGDLDKYNYNTGVFWSDGDGGWNRIKSVKGKTAGWIYFSSTDDDKDSETLVIGFCGKDPGDTNPLRYYPMNINKDTGSVIYKFEFVYQMKVGNEWVDKKVDVLDLVIQPDLPVGNPEINLANPLVYYDYDSSSAISNIVHNRRVHLAKNEAITLSNNGVKFIKNTNLNGDNWIGPSDKVRDYPWETLGKHKLSINRGTDEVIKITKEDGGTISSTYLKGNTTGSVNGTKNEVMFSYDGGNKYLNFGLSKYNFDGDKINDIVITNYDDKSLESRITYSVVIPAFEGIHYAGNYDIKPRQSYTKNYEYRKDILYNEPVIIDYGTVGFRNLDTRITNQSGGDGIDFRAATKVKLVSTKKDSNYVIKGARLYFDGDENKVIGTGTPIETSVFKGENEKSTSKMLKLYIPRQETLIPQGKFKILVDDENDSEKNNKNPLKVGVTVNNNTDKYYTYIGANKRGERGEDLYLNLTVNRFIETRIEFENPELKNDDTGKENWIKLNESDYPNGELTRDINGSNIWGRVRGDVINIPTEYKDANGNLTKKYNLKMTLFDKDGKELINDLNTANGEYKFELSSSTTNNKRYFIISRENPDDNFIRFTLDNGYNCNDQGKPQENPLEFYIRYIDTTTQNDSINKEGDFLFDQRYIVDFKKKADYKGDITLRFKNPAMTEKENTQTNKDGLIDLFKKDYLTDSKGNHNTTQDSIDWVNIGISSNIINEIKNDLVNDYQLNDIDEPTKNITAETVKSFIKKLDANEFVIGLSREKNKFENFFGNYNGQKIDKSFELKFGNDNSRAYRINVIIDKFDPRYYGKVFVEGKDDTVNYEEINNVGEGKIDLTHDNNLQGDVVYIDLATSYRDYMRYGALPTSILNQGLSVRVGEKVEAIPVNSNYEKSVTGEIVLVGENNYISLTDSKGKLIEFSDKIPKSYPMKLKLSLEQYKKLRPYTKYEIFLNGNPNVLTIGTDTLKENILFDKPLSFTTKGPGLTIKAGILDFGQIKPKDEKEQLITKSAKTEILVEITNTLDTKLGVTTQDLVPETDTIYINQVSADGTPMENGKELKVRDLKTTKTKTISPKGTGTTIETYELGGTLEVRKDIPEKNYGEYRGKVMVEYTFY